MSQLPTLDCGLISAKQVIEHLKLEPLADEGGFFRRTYESSLLLTPLQVSDGEKKPLAAGTAIYYLMTPQAFSALHRVKYDEIFHFYGGDPVEMFLIDEDGRRETVILGPDFMNGQHPQFVVPAMVWQGSRIMGEGWSLLGATLAPGFEYADFELGSREKLVSEYPEHRKNIVRYTRNER